MKLRPAREGERCGMGACGDTPALLMEANFQGVNMGMLCLTHMDEFMENLGAEHSKTHPEEAKAGLEMWRANYAELKKTQAEMLGLN